MRTHYCSTLDSIFPSVIQSWVLCFPCETSKNDYIADILRAGFEKTIHQSPYLGGSLEREDTGACAGRFKLTYPDEKYTDCRFFANDMTDKESHGFPSFAELRRRCMPISQLCSELLLPPSGEPRLKSCPVMAQANFIEGGCLLVVCLNHSFVDGSGGARIVEAWATSCRELQQSIAPAAPMTLPVHAIPAVDHGQTEYTAVPRSLILPEVLQDKAAPQGQDLARIQADRTLWQLLGLQKPPLNPVNSAGRTSDRTMLSAIFATSTESILELKSKSSGIQTDSEPIDVSPRLSSFDALAALLWKCIIRSRHLELVGSGVSHTRLRIPMDMRQTLGISCHYLGNVLLNCVVAMPVDALVSQTDVRQIASTVRSTLISSRMEGRAKDAVGLSFALPDLALRRPLFTDMMGPDLVLTSWQDLAYYRHDWGPIFGSPGVAEFVRIPQGNLKGICAIQPRQSQDKIEVLISLERSQMDRLMERRGVPQCFRTYSFVRISS